MKISGHICAQALKKVLEHVDVGVSCLALDRIAKAEIEKRGATSSFMTVGDYQWTICATVNDQVVHGIPTDTALKKGDILGIDVGAIYKGYHSDMAVTVGVGKIALEVKKFLGVGRETLEKAVIKALPGARIGDISATIQKGIEEAGYSIVRNLTGHGIGRYLHEPPTVPGFGHAGSGPRLSENMVLAIEVIYTQGSGEVKIEQDNWTISSLDGSLGGLFEKTVAIARDGPIVLTPYLGF